MKLIVGLGNKGEIYQNTRHNAGFLVIDKIAEMLGEKRSFTLSKKFEAEILKSKEVILMKPQTYMNNSGRAVRKVLDYYKFEIDDLIVIHDDLDLKLGQYKIMKGVGPKIHNGLNSVERDLGAKDFLRVRVGVDSRISGNSYGSGADYVLAKMDAAEKEVIEKTSIEIVDDLLSSLIIKK